MSKTEFSVEYVPNCNNDQIFEILNYLNESYTPNLNTQVDLLDYSKKIAKNGEVIFLNCNDKRIGIIAFYLNSKTCFITSLAIKEKFIGMGLGNYFMDELISILKIKSVNNIELEVHKINKRAIKFYNRMGFEVKSQSKEKCFMKKII